MVEDMGERQHIRASGLNHLRPTRLPVFLDQRPLSDGSMVAAGKRSLPRRCFKKLAVAVWQSVMGPDQALMKPVSEVFVTQITAGDSRDGLCDYRVALNEFVAAPLHQQLHQIESLSFVGIRKSVICNDPVYQRGRLLVDTSVIAVVRASECGLNRMFTYDPWSAAMSKCFLMAANCIGPGDAAMPASDLPAPPWLSGASPRSP